MNIKMRGALVLGACFLSLYCSHKESRLPASGGKPLITDGETQALSDLFGSDSPSNGYRHPMTVSFHTNSDKEYLSNTAKKALQEALIESLGGDVPEQALGKVVAGNLKEAMIENFVKTMRVYKIINTGLQVDLAFVPKANNRNDFSAELSSNQLVRLSETGKLSGKWESLERSTITGSLYHNSVYVPARQDEADYIGGMMSIYVEILDTSPKIKIPSITKNGVKGFIRYRRYYRLNKNLAKSLSCDNFAVNVTRPEGVPLFYTVDLYKNFNLKNLIPTEETLEVFPGLLATSSEGRNELMPRSLEKAGKSISTATFAVEQKRNISGEVSFSLKKLVYSLKEKSLDREKSQVDLIRYYSSGEGGGVGMEDSALANARRTFLKRCESSVEKLLGLEAVVQGGLL
ncbi:hypothetical protein [Bdellovibrio sp.]|uniref:hypothetical protein n=1 Tax=Bdellovibrio sp. TaxID=28201 RepID=UPI0039E21A84